MMGTATKTVDLHQAFRALGAHYHVHRPDWALRPILDVDGLRDAIDQKLHDYGSRRDEHNRNRPTYKICRGKRWEAYQVWQDRARELSDAWNVIAWLRTVVEAYPETTFREFAAWADLRRVA